MPDNGATPMRAMQPSVTEVAVKRGFPIAYAMRRVLRKGYTAKGLRADPIADNGASSAPRLDDATGRTSLEKNHRDVWRKTAAILQREIHSTDELKVRWFGRPAHLADVDVMHLSIEDVLEASSNIGQFELLDDLGLHGLSSHLSVDLPKTDPTRTAIDDELKKLAMVRQRSSHDQH